MGVYAVLIGYVDPLVKNAPGLAFVKQRVISQYALGLGGVILATCTVPVTNVNF
jgi:hypothetical protein